MDRKHDLKQEVAAFEKMKAELEAHHHSKFVVIRGGALVGVWDTFDAAAREAVLRFGRGPYLIRQVGAAVPVVPASVMYRQIACV